MTGLRIRRAEPADAPALTHLHLDCWDEAYAGLVAPEVLAARRADVPGRIATWRGILEAGASVHVALVDSPAGVAEMVGFGCSGPPRDPDPALPPLELRALYVRASWWGTPVGYDLMRVEIGARPAYLRVLETNERAVRFYERNGFVDDGTREEDPDGPLMRMIRS